MSRLALFAVIVLLSASAAFGQVVVREVQDIDREGFEEGPLSAFFLIGYPSGDPPASLDVTDFPGECRSGGHALAFSYSRGEKPVPILLHQVFLQDFEAIDFWIKTGEPVLWVVNIGDMDGAEFSAPADIPGGKWTRVTLTPGDFTCNEDSPVKKGKLETDKLGFGYACFDLFSLFGGRGKNRVLIDDVQVRRTSVTVIDGDYVLTAKKKKLSRNTRVDGDLILTKGSELLVTADRFWVEGDIVVKRSKLLLSGGGWVFNQGYRYHHNMLAVDSGRIEMQDGSLYLLAPYGAGATKGGEVSLRNVRVLSGLFTFGLQKDSSLLLEDCERFGEVIIYRGGSFHGEGSDSFLLWLNLEGGSAADISLPKGDRIVHFELPHGLGRKVTLRGCSNVLWGIIAERRSDITVRDSEIRAFGIHFVGRSRETVRGFTNGNHYKDFSYISAGSRDIGSGGHRLRLVDTKVDTWNFYTSGRAQLEIRDSVFGESISFGRSQIAVYDSVCDGTGGYLGARDDSSTTFKGGEILCDLLSHDRGSITVIDCAGIGGRVEAAGSSKITVANTPLKGPVRQVDDGKVVTE